MVTTTTSPRLARVVPSYHDMPPEPRKKAPPWIQKRTGRLDPSAAGVHTFRYRQSSSWVSVAVKPGTLASAPIVGWGAALPSLVASRTPLHGSGASGGWKRSLPTGGRAYGMPLNERIPLLSLPPSVPSFVSTLTSVTSKLLVLLLSDPLFA